MRTQFIGPEVSNCFSSDRLFEQVDQLAGESFREVAQRRTMKVRLGGADYFAKIHYGVGWREIFKNLLQGRLPVLGARNEWLAIQALRRAGVPTMEAVLYCETGANPAQKRSAILTKSLENRIGLEDFDFADGIVRRRLIRCIAKMARLMHAAGVNHRDYYLCHFLFDPLAHGSALSLIDLHRAQLRKRVPRRWLVKDLGSLLFSALEKPISRRDLFRFVRSYSGNLATLRKDRVFWRDVIKRARKLYLQDHKVLPHSAMLLLEGS